MLKIMKENPQQKGDRTFPYESSVRGLMLGLAFFCLCAVVLFHFIESFFLEDELTFEVTVALLNLRFIALFLMALPFIAFHYIAQKRQALFSMRDPMTGLFNHKSILFELEKELGQAKRHHRPISTMMIDIDNFKRINDQLGHLKGDEVLKNVAQTLSKSLRKADVAGRYGGDEFLVILPDSGREEVKKAAERFKENIRKMQLSTSPGEIPFSVSIGLFSFHNGQDIDKNMLIDKADQALLSAKDSGKDKILLAA